LGHEETLYVDDFVLMNFRNGRKIIGRKKKNIPN